MMIRVIVIVVVIMIAITLPALSPPLPLLLPSLCPPRLIDEHLPTSDELTDIGNRFDIGVATHVRLEMLPAWRHHL